MPTCVCGFDFAKALSLGRKLESYAVISDRDFLKVIRKERAILAERTPDKRLRLIAEASQWVGSLAQCPRCRSWLFLKPFRAKGRARLLLKAAPDRPSSVRPQGVRAGRPAG
jgi:hypothetical protein